MTDQDVDVAREHGGKPFEVEAPEGGSFRVRFVESDAEAYDRFYNIIANPMLWFIQHYLWDLSNAPDIRRHEVEAFEQGYQTVNRDLAEAVIDEIEGQDEPVVMVHDYHLYTLPGDGPRGAPGRLPAPLRPHPVDPAGRLAGAPERDARARSTPACWRTTSSASTRKSYQRNFLQCCRDLMDLEVDFEDGVVVCDGREVWVRAYPLPIDYEATRGVARRPRVREFEERVLARRREYAILRVDRADLSKNVLRGFTAFDIFLEQHPEFAERITFTAQLMPSRTDVPEYAEYLEKIEALVAVVNHRHGTPDWMPIDLKLRDDLDEAVASYKHYDVMMVNAMFDGMNLVAKEGPLVNERHGVSILSENTGAHEELGEFALSVNPFDVQELADAIYSALMMSPEARERRARGLKEIVTSRDPGDWIDEQIADIRAKTSTRAPRATPSKPNSPARACARAAAARGAGGATRRGARAQARGVARRAPACRAVAAPRASAPPRVAAAALPARASRRRAASARAPAPRARRLAAPRRPPRAAAARLSPRSLASARARRSSARAPRARTAVAGRRARRPSSAIGSSREQRARRVAGQHGRSAWPRAPTTTPTTSADEPAAARATLPQRTRRSRFRPMHLLGLRRGAFAPRCYHPRPHMASGQHIYDLTLLLDPAVEAERREQIVADVADLIDRTGEFIGRHDWGTRQTAYEVRKKAEADYHLIQFRGENELLEQLDHNLKITDGVLRHRIIKLRPGTPDPPDLRPSAQPAAEAAEAAEPAEA